MQPLAHPPVPRDAAFAAVYRAHHDFVWRTLRHLGVDPGRIDDALQDTFLVVYRRLAEFEGRSALRTWIFEIARRVAARHRRIVAREAPRRCALPELSVDPRFEEDIARAEAAEILREFLAGLDPDKSVVFMMAELEQLRAPEIAEALAVNLNTVYARLRAARQQLDRVVARIQAREQRPRIRRAAEVIAAALLVPLPASAKAWSPAPLALAPSGPGSAGAPPLAHGLAGTLGGPPAIVAGLTLAGVLTLGAVGLLGRPAAKHDAAEPPASSQRGGPVPTRLSHETGPDITAPLTRPASVTPTPAPPAPSRAREGGTLEQELALIEPARAALLAGDARRALGLLTRHRRQFPASMFDQEVAATRIEALCRLGDGARARREMAEFTRRWPASNLSARVASLCDE